MNMYNLINSDKPIDPEKTVVVALSIMNSWNMRQEDLPAELLAQWRDKCIKLSKKDPKNEEVKWVVNTIKEYEAIVEDIFGSYVVKKVTKNRGFCSVPAIVSHLLGWEIPKVLDWFARNERRRFKKADLNLQTYNALEILQMLGLLNGVWLDFWHTLDNRTGNVTEMQRKIDDILTEIRDLLGMVKKWSDRGNLVMYISETKRTKLTKANAEFLLGGSDKLFFIPLAGTVIIGGLAIMALMGLRNVTPAATEELGSWQVKRSESLKRSLELLLLELDEKIATGKAPASVIKERALVEKQIAVYNNRIKRIVGTEV